MEFAWICSTSVIVVPQSFLNVQLKRTKLCFFVCERLYCVILDCCCCHICSSACIPMLYSFVLYFSKFHWYPGEYFLGQDRVIKSGHKLLPYAECCFIKYATSQEADRAIRLLHNQYTLPGVNAFGLISSYGPIFLVQILIHQLFSRELVPYKSDILMGNENVLVIYSTQQYIVSDVTNIKARDLMNLFSD